MNKILFKLRLFGIASFLLFFVSSMFSLPKDTGGFSFNQVQQISILVSVVIFAFLMLVHLYGLFARAFSREDES